MSVALGSSVRHPGSQVQPHSSCLASQDNAIMTCLIGFKLSGRLLITVSQQYLRTTFFIGHSTKRNISIYTPAFTSHRRLSLSKYHYPKKDLHNHQGVHHEDNILNVSDSNAQVGKVYVDLEVTSKTIPVFDSSDQNAQAAPVKETCCFKPYF